MVIRLDENYNAMTSTALLGYVGETNARPVSFEGLTVDGADRYVLTIDYGDGVEYEVDITGGQWTPTADVLRSAQTVSCQICAKKLSGQEYILVKKSRIFRLRIGAAIGDTAIPSPDVAVDALDRIETIGRQAHADMQTAQTAAKTATTSAEDAEKSATAAEKSADTAEQAASRAETAKTAAETSATQADTAKQGAETARQQAVTAQNAAKISAAQAATSAQQTTADKNITAGYAKTAKTCADSTAADRQAVQTLAEQVTADKANVAENAAKVAEDRTAAETAAQTAQAVADSLPDDYTTAVGKIAENTAEIGRVKLTDKELTRRVNALYDMGQGITHQFETDSDTAYAKTVPTGARLMSVKSVGGRSIVWNQLVKPVPAVVTGAGVKVTFSDDGIITLNGTATTTGSAVSVQSVKNQKGHKYLMIANPLSGVYGANQLLFSSQSFGQDSTGHGTIIVNESSNAVWYYTIYVYEGVTYDNVKILPQIFDLTTMFGSGNEPSTVEEFEKMFPADYYPYCAGEIVSAGTEVVVEQGANLCDPTIFSTTYPDRIAVKNDIIDVISGIQSMFESGVALKIPQGYSIAFFPIAKKNATTTNGRIRALFSDGSASDIAYITDANGKLKSSTTYVAKKDISAIAFNWSAFIGGFAFKMQITQNATDLFVPYHRNEYSIPEAIRNLPGYGWSAGTAKNYVDYENKKYYKCIDSMDLGTVRWQVETSPAFGTYFSTFVDSRKFKKIGDFAQKRHNILCDKYLAVKRDVKEYVDKTILLDGTVSVVTQIQVKDTAYTDVAAFKQAMQGVMLYYELAEPIVTDISTMIDDDFLRNISVEAGGSITFKNDNDDYRLPVSSEEEYVVKLSEVGGTT